MAEEKIYYNHAYDLAFEVMTTNPEGGKATKEEIIEGLKRRLKMFEENEEELRDAVDCYDPMDEEYTEEQRQKWLKME